ncbi:MAG: VWA domain-containing protein [Acidobacteria bacterium]|nr:VWA domain-containing protein [Acidobacteriota bacterium]
MEHPVASAHPQLAGLWARSGHVRRTVCGLSSALFSSCAIAVVVGISAQQLPPPTFRTGVDAVVVDVSVLDKDRRPVRDLTAADFTIIEDGKPQTIATFSAVDLPDVAATGSVGRPETAWLSDVPADVTTNSLAVDGRVIVLVLDDLSPMAPGEAVRAKGLATLAIDKLSPSDLTAVVFTAGREASQNVTTDHARLTSAVRRYVPRMRRDFDRFEESSGPIYLSVTATIRNLVQGLAGLGPRRIAVLWISAGIPIALEGGPSRSAFADQLKDEWAELLAAAGRANVSIYGLDPGGLRGQALDLQIGPTTWNIGGSELAPGGTREEGLINRRFLQDVAANTGGFAVTGSNDPGPGIAQVFAETGSYYLLGYQSSNPPGKKVHKLDVRVNRADLTVHSRTRYSTDVAVASKASVSAHPLLTGALRGLLPVRDVGLRAAAAPFMVPGGAQPNVAVVLGVDQTTPTRQKATLDDVDVVISAYRADGKPAGSVTSHVKVGLPAGAEKVQYEVLTRIEVGPGHYDLRIAAATTFGAKTGSVTCEVDVPNFAKDRLSLSGVVLSAEPGGMVAPRDALRSILPVVPTSRRSFSPSETVTALVRVYQGGKDATVTAALSAAIIDALGEAVFESHETLGPSRFGRDRSTEYRLVLPLSRLAPGPHLLTLDATLGKEVARRAVRFDVR